MFSDLDISAMGYVPLADNGNSYGNYQGGHNENTDYAADQPGQLLLFGLLYFLLFPGLHLPVISGLNLLLFLRFCGYFRRSFFSH